MNYDIVDRLRDLRSCTADEAANLIEALRKANSEVMATGIKSVRDTAELAIELRETKRERDEARRMYCGRVSCDVPLDAFEIAKNHEWDCFKEDGK